MGSAVSRNKRKNTEEVDVVKKRAIFFGCYGMFCEENRALDSSSRLSRSSTVSFNNNRTSRFIISLNEIESPEEFDQEKGSNLLPDEEESYFEKLISSYIGGDGNLLVPPISMVSSSESLSSFEPVPLTQVLPQLYLGTEDDAEQAEKLFGLGITHVISIVGGGRYKDIYPNHRFIKLRDNGSSDLLEKLENSYDFIMESQENGNKLFVHCQLGQNRSASFVIGFLMKWRNMSFYDAYSLLKEKRELIHPNQKYIEQLRQLDLQLHKVYSTPENFLDIEYIEYGPEILDIEYGPEIGIKFGDFSKADSEAFKIAQKLNLKQDGQYLSSQLSLHSEEGSSDLTPFFTICLPGSPGSDDSESKSTVQ